MFGLDLGTSAGVLFLVGALIVSGVLNLFSRKPKVSKKDEPKAETE